MNKNKLNKINSLRIFFGLLLVAPVSAVASDSLKLRESCGPVLERKASMLPQHTKGWVNMTYGKVEGNTAVFVRETVGNPGQTQWTLTSGANGAISLTGYWEHQTDGRRFTYIPVNLFAEKFPISTKTRYMMGDGFRECEVTFSLESGKALATADFFRSPTPVQVAAPASPPDLRISQNATGVAQNREDIAVNRQAIATTKVQVAENTAGVAQNREGIAVNRQAIAITKVQLAENTAGVAQNRQGIAQNQQVIAQNQQEMKSRTTTVTEKYSKATTGTAETWATYMSGVPFQQNQFCRIIQNWREDLAMAQQQRNQIKENIAYRTREQRLTALMPDGNFQNWIVRAISVKQASDGSASVLFELPCDVVIGSHACGMTPKNFLGTIAENSRLYSELVTISVGDFLGVSGSFSFIDEKASFKKDRSVASFTTMKAGTHCDAKEVAKPESEFFASQVATLSTLK